MRAVIKLGCPRGFVVRDLPRHFQLAPVLQIGSDTGGAEAMIANRLFEQMSRNAIRTSTPSSVVSEVARSRQQLF